MYRYCIFLPVDECSEWHNCNSIESIARVIFEFIDPFQCDYLIGGMVIITIVIIFFFNTWILLLGEF